MDLARFPIVADRDGLAKGLLRSKRVTTGANDDVGQLHDRMPVLLPRDAWQVWLDPDQQDQELLRSLLGPAPDGVLEMHPVSRRVNDVREDGPDLVDAVPEEPMTGDPGAPTEASGGSRRGAPAAGQGTLFD